MSGKDYDVKIGIARCDEMEVSERRLTVPYSDSWEFS